MIKADEPLISIILRLIAKKDWATARQFTLTVLNPTDRQNLWLIIHRLQNKEE